MSKLIFHIGTHKTATTYLQEICAHNRPLLGAHNVIYPTIGEIPGHHMLAAEWVDLGPEYTLPQGTGRIWDYLIQTYADSDKTVVLSSEEFSRAQTTRVDMAELRARADAFDHVQVVCFLRAQPRFMQSAYVEISRIRPDLNLPGVMETALNDHLIDGLWLDYNGLYEHLLTGFDPSELSFVPFDQAARGPGGVLRTFMDIIGCAAPEDRFDTLNVFSNPSPDPLPVWLSNSVMTPQLLDMGMVDFMGEVLAEQFGVDFRSCLFTREEITRLAAAFDPLNARFVERVKPHQPHFTLAPIDSDPNLVHRDDLDTTFWLRLARGLHRR